MTPRFSIVIPTRNRAGLVGHALTTALAQERDDLEVVVSDNASDDGTREAVADFSDDRLRYVRSEQPLSNADSWEFAVSHARGDWVTVLGDDDGLVPSLIDRIEPRLSGDAPVVGWRTAYYVHPDTDPPWPNEDERNLLTVHPYTGELLTVGADHQLRRMFDRREIEPLPSVRDCFVRRWIVDELSAGGGVFGEPDPHWANAVGVLTQIERYAILDLPLSVTGASTINIGGNFLTNTRATGLSEEFDRGDLLSAVPLQQRTCVNVVAETLMRCKGRFAAELVDFEIDRVRYYVTSRAELADPRRNDDGGLGVAEWRRVLASEPPAVQDAVVREWRRLRLRGAARRLARGIPGARTLWHGLGGDTELHHVRGAAHGFDDLAGAAAHVDAILSEPVPVEELEHSA